MTGSYDAVEWTEELLVSGRRAPMCSAGEPRRREEAVAISNCCLVCSCMTLGGISIVPLGINNR